MTDTICSKFNRGIKVDNSNALKRKYRLSNIDIDSIRDRFRFVDLYKSKKKVFKNEDIERYTNPPQQVNDNNNTFLTMLGILLFVGIFCILFYYKKTG